MPETEELLATAVGHLLPPPIIDTRLEARVRDAIAAANHTVVALDDDPTGVQTVHSVPVLAEWSPGVLAQEMARREPLFFVLTNSRSLTGADASRLSREIGERLQQAAQASHRGLAIVSRSDSTLRGHFPGETDTLAEALGGVDGVLICPAFIEGGRVTVDDTHFLLENGRAVPVSETEFARDATFGYSARTLPEWVAEKSAGRLHARDVASISLEDIRLGGVGRVTELLKHVHGGQHVILNVVNYPDLWTVVLGILQAEAAGKQFLYRTGASFVRARAGITARALLTRAELLPHPLPTQPRGLVVVGSHVQRTSEQLTRLLTHPGTVALEVHVPELLSTGDRHQAELERVGKEVHEALMKYETPVVFTSREIERPAKLNELEVGRRVSSALVRLVQGIRLRPDFVIGKGGITSSDVGTRGLAARRAMVLGQVRPGVPVWQLGEESRFPGLSYIVFPGNVGTQDTLLDIVSDLLDAQPTM
jgi:uncharacterized protein YgbK (DUF1537 family)